MLLLRNVVSPFSSKTRERIVLVLDNHPSHSTQHVLDVARNLNIELLFQPKYSPEFNSIESLWSVFKLGVKNRFQAHQDVILNMDDFKQLLRDQINDISPE